MKKWKSEVVGFESEVECLLATVVLLLEAVVMLMILNSLTEERSPLYTSLIPIYS